MKHCNRILRRCCACLLALIATAPFSAMLNAQELARIPFVDVPAGTPGLGVGFRSATSPYLEDNTRTDMVPLYLFEGKRFFSYGTEAGIHMWGDDRFYADALARYRFNRLDENEDFLAGVNDRYQTVDGGFRIGMRGDWGEIDAVWVTDLGNRHNGEEVNLNLRRRFDVGRWSMTPWVSFIWQDTPLVNYYYGVSPEESRPDLPVYSPGRAFNAGFGVNTTWYAAEQILVFANAGFYGFDSEIQNSPLVAEDSTAAGYFGAAFLFGSVNESRFVPQERRREWSWRVNYGYQAHANIVGGISHGDFSRSEFADTAIAGFTASKLLVGGDKVDFYGRLAVFRHNEKGLQENFWSFAPYVMAVGKGYLPWTEDVAFRFGFGLGASYAQKVPIVEQIKQARKDGNTSHFLNYLEMMVDFSLERVAPRFGNCFAGATIVHRSGIFSTSDLLGNVDGGSDWLTLHLECLR